ncbi:hypothetical protein O7634_14185 [Micromonospora sp. WMMD1120]|uniref:hypothetical protein n=1 Tax=Micromonospora sp. WMMD1120 TaxID=3016106 RepID=UPI00241770F2|nr:hypothetical protein [Micromonospora sp. WMMD1120]MDG4807901.1 hypothetical protein [Micromonospora sp. WMMD1120]
MTGHGTPADGAPSTLSWLGHPVTVLALVLLLVNDHVLKSAFPGPVTGKLSDAAGLVLAPPLVAVLLTLLAPRLPPRAAALAGLVGVGAGFAIVKSSGYAAELASSAWTVLAGSSLVRADRTDLLTVPALGLAWWSWTRARRRPVRRRTARLVRLLVVLPSALLAVAATSPAYHPYALGTALLDGQPAVSIGFGGSNQNWPTRPADGEWWVGEHGGARWRLAEPAEVGRLSRQDIGQRQACVPTEPRRCYRAVAGQLRVEQSDDAGVTWRMAWELSGARREELARRSSEPGDVREHFASRDLIVYPVVGGGHEVLVANGRDGVLRRNSDGLWRRDGFLEGRFSTFPVWEDPPPLDGGGPGDRQLDLLLAVTLALTLGCAVVGLAGQLAIRRGGGPRWWGIAGGAALLVAGIVLALAWERADDTLAFLAVPFVLAVGVLTALALLLRARYQGVLRQWTGQAIGGGLLTTLLAVLPLVGWLYGTPARTRFAVALALLATAPGVLLAVRIAGLADPARGFERRYPPRPPYPPYGPCPPAPSPAPTPEVPDPPYPPPR